MNVYAYHPTDDSRTLIHIDEWVVKYGIRTDGCCRVCHQKVYVKASMSQKQTHFAHYNGSGCPSVADNRKPYEVLSNLPRDETIAAAAKEWLKNHVAEVYEKLRREFKELGLLWTEFFQLVETANKLDIWSLKDMPYECIPYVLLMCRDKFEKNQYRKTSCYFVLEPSPQGLSYWNENGKYKRLIWEVSLPTRNVKKHEINKNLGTPWYISKINTLLK